MKPNFEEMSKAELKAYVLAHREDTDINLYGIVDTAHSTILGTFVSSLLQHNPAQLW